LREHLWRSIFREAARSDISLIFTFAPERTVSTGFPAAAESIILSEGGRVLFVSLCCAEPELERRISDRSRSSFRKLQSPSQYRELRDSGAFKFPPLRADLEVDTGSLPPSMAAQMIKANLAAA